MALTTEATSESRRTPDRAILVEEKMTPSDINVGADWFILRALASRCRQTWVDFWFAVGTTAAVLWVGTTFGSNCHEEADIL